MRKLSQKKDQKVEKDFSGIWAFQAHTWSQISAGKPQRHRPSGKKPNEEGK